MTKYKRLIYLSVYFISLASFAEETNHVGPLETIQVTAQKRIQSVQDIPISISALSGQSLDSMQLNQASQITTLIPNVNATRSISGISNYFIRGVGMDGFNLSSVPAVGIYIDDVAVINPMLANFALYDIARVEVLKGPQNTLYGRNTTGGAINFISNQANSDKKSGYGQITLGNHQQRYLQAAFSSQINDKLNFRLASFYHQRDGLISSEVAGNNTEFNDVNQFGGRAQIRYQMAQNITLSASLYAGKQNQIAEVKTAINGLGDDGVIDLDDFDLSKNHSELINPPNDIEAIGGYVKVNLDQASYRFNSITSFESVESERMDDWGSQQLPSTVYQSTTYNSTDTSYLSQEFQWQSNSQGPLQWIAGLLFSDEQGDLLQAALIDPSGPGRPDDDIADAGIGPMFDRGAWVEQQSRTYSAYSQINYALSSQLNLTSGLRWSTQDLTPTVSSAGMMMDLPGQEFPLGSFGWLSLGNNDFDRFADHLGFVRAQRFIAANGGLPASEKIDKRFNEWGGKLALDYHVSRYLMLYGSWSRGFKMGAVNSNPTTTAYQGLLNRVVKPETLITTEIGFKSDLNQFPLRINAAIFRNQWQNYQFFLVHNPGNPADLFASLVNLPEARSEGAEVDLVWKVSPSLRLNLGIGWLDSEVINGNLDTVGIPEQNNEGLQNQVKRGNKLTNAPQWTYSMTAMKSFQLQKNDIDVSIHYSHMSEHSHQLAGNNSQTWVKNFSDKAVGILTLNAVWLFGENREYQIVFWAKNVTDQQYCSERSVAPGTSPETVRLCAQGEPRTLGLTAKVIF